MVKLTNNVANNITFWINLNFFQQSASLKKNMSAQRFGNSTDVMTDMLKEYMLLWHHHHAYDRKTSRDNCYYSSRLFDSI